MTIKVIKRGDTTDNKIYKTICYICESELEFTALDGKPGFDFRNGTSYFRIFCPICDAEITQKI